MKKKIKIGFIGLIIGIVLIGGWWVWSQVYLGLKTCIDSNEQCRTKPDGAGCTTGVWCDQFGRVCGGQSCVDMGLGKCFKGRCVSLKEYENLTRVVITLNKRVYEQGEEVKAKANFDGEIFVFSAGAWSIYKWDNNSWIKLAESTDCSSSPPCEEINFDKIENCNFPICEASAWYKIDKSHPYAQWRWSQKHPTGGMKSYKCKMGKKIIDHECLVYSQALPGKYKIRFEYALSAEEFSLKRKGIDTQYTEQEFTIKKDKTFILPDKEITYCQRLYSDYSSKITNLDKTCVNNTDCIEKMYRCGMCVSKNNNFNELDELYSRLLRCEADLDPKIFYSEIYCPGFKRCSCECVNNTCQYAEHCIY